MKISLKIFFDDSYKAFCVELAAPWRCEQHIREMWWRCCGDVVEMLWRCSGDVAEMLWRCCGDVVEMLWRCKIEIGDVAEMLSEMLSVWRC